MPQTPSTSYRLSATARALIAALARKWGYRYREVIERAIREAAEREGIRLDDTAAE